MWGRNSRAEEQDGFGRFDTLNVLILTLFIATPFYSILICILMTLELWVL